MRSTRRSDFISKGFLKIIFTLGVLSFLSMYLWKIDWYMVLNQLLDIGWQYLWVIPISGTAYILGTLAWKYCIDLDHDRISFMNLFVVRHIGETLAIINPTSVVAGDGAKYYLLKKKNNHNAATVSSILLSRIIIINSAVALITLTLLYMIGKTVHVGSGGQLLFGLSVILFLINVLIWRITTSNRLLLFTIVKYVFRPFLHSRNIQRKIVQLKWVNKAIVDYKADGRNRLLLAYVFSFLHWIIGSTEIWFMLHVLGIDISFISALVVEMGVTFIKNMGAFIPGQVGVEEYGNKTMVALIGIVSPVIWVSLSIMRRFRQMIWIFIGVIFYSIYKRV